MGKECVTLGSSWLCAMYWIYREAKIIIVSFFCCHTSAYNNKGWQNLALKHSDLYISSNFRNTCRNKTMNSDLMDDFFNLIVEDTPLPHEPTNIRDIMKQIK